MARPCSSGKISPFTLCLVHNIVSLFVLPTTQNPLNKEGYNKCVLHDSVYGGKNRMHDFGTRDKPRNFSQRDDEFGHRYTAVTLTERSYLLPPVGDYNHEVVEQYVRGALVPEVEGIDDFLEILGPEVYERDQKEGNSIHGDLGSDRDMIVGTCWHRWYAKIASSTRKFGNSARDRRNHVEPHRALLCA
jgi:hypothetical protein